MSTNAALDAAIESVYDRAIEVWRDLSAQNPGLKPQEVPVISVVINRYVSSDGVERTSPGQTVGSSLDTHAATVAVSEALKDSAQFMHLGSLARSAAPNQNLIEFALDRLRSAAANEAVGGNPEKGEIKRRFLLAITSYPYVRHSLDLLFGVRIETGPLIVSRDGATIEFRKASDDDLNLGRNPWVLPHPFQEFPTTAVWTTSQFEGDHGGMDQQLGLAAEVMLGLFKVGWIKSHSQNLYAEALIDHPGQIHSLNSYVAFRINEFLLTVNDEQAFCDHCDALWDSLIDFRRGDRKLEYVDRAYTYYRDALESPHPEPELVSRLMRSLEALLLRSDAEGINQVLTTRVGLLCDLMQIAFRPVIRVLSHAYNVRSRHVHGEVLGSSDRRAFDAALSDLGGWTTFCDVVRRILLLGWLLNQNKTAWLDILRDAMISSTGRQALEDLYAPFGGKLTSLSRPLP